MWRYDQSVNTHLTAASATPGMSRRHALKVSLAGAAAAAAMVFAAPASASAAVPVCVVDSGAHGDGMLATVRGSGVQPRYVDVGPGATFSSLAAGVRACSDQGAGVISVSYAGPQAPAEWSQAVAYAASRGALVLLAAGNTNTMATECGGSTCQSALVAGAVSVTMAGELPGQVQVPVELATVGGYGGSSAATAYAAGVAGRTGARTAAEIARALSEDLAALTGDGSDPLVDEQPEGDRSAPKGSAGADHGSGKVNRFKLKARARRSGGRVVISASGLRAGQRIVVRVGADQYEGSRARVVISQRVRASLPRRVLVELRSGERVLAHVRVTVSR